MEFTGIDVANPGSERTVISARRGGKTAALERVVEQCLDAGQTVIVMTPDGYELRRADVAKDVTPATKKPPEAGAEG